MTPTLTTLLLFAAISLLTASVLLVFRDLANRRQIVEARFRTDGDGQFGLPLSVERAPVTPAVTTRIDQFFERLETDSGLDLPVQTAGLATFATGLLSGGIVLLWRDNWLAAGLVAAAGMLIVPVALLAFRTRRRRLMREQLPDAIALMARAVRAGETLEQSMQLAGDQVAEPLATEFRQCVWRLAMGLSVDATMRTLVRRVPVGEIQILASTLIVQRRAGGNLAEALESLALVIRDRINYLRHFRAATAASRLSFALIAASGPLLAAFLWIRRPEYFQNFLIRPYGTGLMATAMVLYLLGCVWALRLLQPKY
jgi:tight adherence protein B